MVFLFDCRPQLSLGRRGLFSFALPSQDALTVQHIFQLAARCLRLVLFLRTLETVQTCPETKLTSFCAPQGTGSSQSFSASAQANATAAAQFCRLTLIHFSCLKKCGAADRCLSFLSTVVHLREE